MNNNPMPNGRRPSHVDANRGQVPNPRVNKSGYSRNPAQPRNNQNRVGAAGRGQAAPSRPTTAQNQTSSGMSRIANQSPAKRQPSPQRVKLTAEQIEINHINRRRERYYLQKRRKNAIRVFLSRLALFFVVFAIMLALTAGIFYLNLTSNDSESAARYSYTIGDKKYSLSFGDAVREGRVYVNFNDIAELCDLAITGDADDMKFIVKGDETETIRFVGGSRAVFVNGFEARLGSSSYVEGEDIFVPVDFVIAYLKGVDIELDERANTVSVSRNITNLGENGKLPKGEEAIYEELSFLLQSPLGLMPLTEEEEAFAEAPDLGFVTSLSFYEEFMNPGNTDEYLILVNRENKLTAEHVPQDLTEVSATRDDGRNMQLLRFNAAMALEAMFKELRAAGFEDVSVTSAYRSYSYQESLYNSYVQAHGEEQAKTFSMPAGASEHQTGLCVDMHNLPGADKVFANEPAYDWLRENCWKFGFILRFPADKMDITTIDFEPWHYRYVGRYHAQRMYESGMCLEEYVAYISAGTNIN